jgi:hypothetical protein
LKKISKVSVCSPWIAESIGVLFVKIGRTVKKLIRREFSKKWSFTPLNGNLKNFDDPILFRFFCLIDGCITFENQWNGSKVIQRGSFRNEDCSLAPLN